MRERSTIPKDSFNGCEATGSGSQRPISSIFQEIGAHLTEIFRSEIQLARAEIRQDARQVAKASIVIGIGAILAAYGLGFLLLAAVYALGKQLPLWLSALVVGSGLALPGAIFLLVGRKRMKVASLTPDKTIQSLQENVTWLKKRTE